MKYTIKTTEEKVKRWKSLIVSNWWQVSETKFKVSGVYGLYKFEDWTLYVDIQDKPRLASRWMIESKLKDFFS